MGLLQARRKNLFGQKAIRPNQPPQAASGGKIIAGSGVCLTVGCIVYELLTPAGNKRGLAPAGNKRGLTSL
ncbi:MAG: hypothetical protein WAV28_06070 [Sedimentisphaerales bacterium]